MQDVSIETNIWESSLKDIRKSIVKDNMPTDYRAKCYIKGMDLIGRGKVALVLQASEFAFIGDEVKFPCLEPLPLPSKKTNLQMLLERVHHLVRKGRTS